MQPSSPPPPPSRDVDDEPILPTDLFQFEIFQHLNWIDLWRFRLVCRFWSRNCLLHITTLIPHTHQSLRIGIEREAEVEEVAEHLIDGVDFGLAPLLMMPNLQTLPSHVTISPEFLQWASIHLPQLTRLFPSSSERFQSHSFPLLPLLPSLKSLIVPRGGFECYLNISAISPLTSLETLIFPEITSDDDQPDLTLTNLTTLDIGVSLSFTYIFVFFTIGALTLYSYSPPFAFPLLQTPRIEHSSPSHQLNLPFFERFLHFTSFHDTPPTLTFTFSPFL
eukprot:TRINITY_DN2706_c0_g1_i1.p1 TRINITY_DN2706_c0_g1~~TRINITY_DN2706_c0_g1_i1.p1  ORF type:complete len:299 (+),score=74.12 TRINITY_DN2706_c0_g1_i1:64-897(+)